MALWLTVKNIGSTLIGQTWTSLLGLLTLPVIVRGFGAEAYGLLSLSLSVVGVASLCDLGIGRALSKYVAEDGDGDSFGRTNRNIHSALSMTLSLAAVSTAAFALATPFLVSTVFHVRDSLAADARLVFLFTAAAVPAVLVRILLDGILVGKQRIAMLSGVNAAAATAKIAVAFTTALSSSPVHFLVLGYCAISYLHAAALGWLCFRGRSPVATLGLAWNFDLIRELLRLGSLSTVASGMSYVFYYLDRWVIAAILPMSVLGYYTVAFDIASRQQYITNAIGQAFFPVFSRSARLSREALTASYLQASKMTFVATTGLAVVLAGFAEPLLTCWISPEMGANASLLLKILSIGMVLSCYFNLPATAMLAGSGRPEVIAVQVAWAAVLHLAISMATIRWLGAAGVALGFGAGYLLALCRSHLWLGRHALSNNTLEQLYKYLWPCWVLAVAVGVPLAYVVAPMLVKTLQVLAAMAVAYAVYITIALLISYSEGERSQMRQRALSLIPLRFAGGRT